MDAIRISNKIKNQNNQDWVQNREVGDIVKRDYPKKFFVTEKVVGEYPSRTDLHFADGWRPYLNLVDGVDYNINPKSQPQKLNTNLIVGYPIGDPLENRTHYAFKIVDLTVEEYEAEQDNGNQLSARQSLELYTENGQEFVREFRTKLFRRTNQSQEENSSLTKVQVGKMDRWFNDVYTVLLVGNFREARRLVGNLVIEKWNGVFDDGQGNEVVGNGDLENAPMRFIANWFYTEINTYFDEQYDM